MAIDLQKQDSQSFNTIHWSKWFWESPLFCWPIQSLPAHPQLPLHLALCRLFLTGCFNPNSPWPYSPSVVVFSPQPPSTPRPYFSPLPFNVQDYIFMYFVSHHMQGLQYTIQLILSTVKREPHSSFAVCLAKHLHLQFNQSLSDLSTDEID